MVVKQSQYLFDLGFRTGKSSIHTARTMMLAELQNLLAYVDDEKADITQYRSAICNDNCLVKRSEKSRLLTLRHLQDLYSLDATNVLYRNLLYFWSRDTEGQPLISLLCAVSRDTILSASSPLLQKKALGELITREEMEYFIDNLDPGRFSPATLKSVAQNVNSTWTQTGHLNGRAKKIRTQAKPTPGSVAYALLLAYLTGERGENLFKSEFVQLLDCSYESAIGYAATASQKGWITFKQVGNVVEVLFPKLLTYQELELLHE